MKATLKEYYVISIINDLNKIHSNALVMHQSNNDGEYSYAEFASYQECLNCIEKNAIDDYSYQIHKLYKVVATEIAG